MNPLVSEWITKAEGDWNTAKRESRVRKNPNYDAVCFHSQQCGEKYLKAYLQAMAVKYPKTHDLLELLRLCSMENVAFELHRDVAIQLNRYAVLI